MRPDVVRLISLVVALTLVLGGTASPASAAVDLDTLPSLTQAQRLFPHVTAQDRQGYSTSGVQFPTCADSGGAEPGANPVHVWVADFYKPDDGKRGVSASATLYPFKKKWQAKRVMSRIKKHVAACRGLQTGVEDYSRFRSVPVSGRLGDDRIAFRWEHAYEFEGGVSRAHVVWARTGRTVAEVSVHRERGPIPAAATNAFARLVVKRAR